VAGATVEDLTAVQGMGNERAKKLIEDAVDYINRKKMETESEKTLKDNGKSIGDDVTNGGE